MLFLLYGKPGTGKTTMASTMVKLGYKVHYIDVDGKLAEQQNLQVLIKHGQITYETIQHPLSSSSLKLFAQKPKAALTKQPKGYLEYCDIIDRLVDDMNSKRPPIADVLVCPDSITALSEHLRRFLLHMSPPKGDLIKPDWDIWSAILANWEEHFSILKALHGYFKHIISISHEWTERETGDDTSGRLIGIKPYIEGGFRQKLSKEFHEVYRLETVGTAMPQAGKGKASIVKEITYRCLTRSADFFEARTTLDIDTYMPQDFSIILKEVKDA